MIVYVELPEEDVTMTVIKFAPEFIVIAPDAEPDVTETPLTVMEVPAAAAGVTVMAETAFANVIVYEVTDEENTGLRVP